MRLKVKENDTFSKDMRELIYIMDGTVEEDTLSDIMFDLMPTCFEELVASKSFAMLDEGRKKRLFRSYVELTRLLDGVEKFFERHGKSPELSINSEVIAISTKAA